MLGDLLGRLLGGAAWGVGAGLVLAVTRDNGSGLRPVGKALMQTYIAAAELVQHSTAEARERIEDLYAEVKAEQQNGATQGSRQGPKANGRTAEVRD